jgi:hypothetical protein
MGWRLTQTPYKDVCGACEKPDLDRNIWLCSTLYPGLQKIPAHVILMIPHK